MSAKQGAAFNSINRCCSFRVIFGPSFLMDSSVLLQIFCNLFVLKYITILNALQHKKLTQRVNVFSWRTPVIKLT